MKKLIILVIGFGLFGPGGILFAQSSVKIGHVDISEIMNSLPEKDSAQVRLDKETKEIESTFEEMQVIYSKLVDDYQKGQSSFTEVVKNAKEAEIIDKQKRIQEFQQNASETLQKRNAELFQPIYQKIIRAIEKAANEGGFTYILDISKGSVVFVSKESQNLNQLVLKVLKTPNK